MKLHANARLSVKGRELLIDRIENESWSVMEAAQAAGITVRTVRKWLARHRADGLAGLVDRSSAPNVVANRTEERRVEAIAALRRVRLTGAEIAELLQIGSLDGVGDPDADRDGQARPARPGASGALRARAPG